MATYLARASHTVGESNLHLVFTPAYRRDIFRDPLVRELTLAYIMERAQQMKIQITAIECGPDHVHVFVQQFKNWAIKDIARELKSYSSRKMRQGHASLFQHKLWGKKFWSGGYFHRTVGAVTADTVERYVLESQKKHWGELERSTQHTLLNYAEAA